MYNFKIGDINILVSMINMKLRDEFSTLDSFINYYGLNEMEIYERMEKEGYYYCREINQFKKK